MVKPDKICDKMIPCPAKSVKIVENNVFKVEN